MKKIIILSFFISSVSAFSQINLSTNPSTQNLPTNNSAFLDASSNYDTQNNGSNNAGKGFVFPQVNLPIFEFDITTPDGGNVLPTFYDGMIVYNVVDGTVNEKGTKTATQGKRVKVKPGFYYFSNPKGRDNMSVAEGQWVRIGSGEANEVPVADYKSTAVATGAKFYTSSATEGKPVYRKMISLNFNGTYAKLPDNTFSANDVFVNAYLVNQATAEVVGSVKIKRDIEVNSVRGDYVFSSNGSLYTTLSGAHKLIVEYYGK